jgi:hypothetical protein
MQSNVDPQLHKVFHEPSDQNDRLFQDALSCEGGAYTAPAIHASEGPFPRFASQGSPREFSAEVVEKTTKPTTNPGNDGVGPVNDGRGSGPAHRQSGQ